MSLTLVFCRKYRWPEHYFSVWFLENSPKLLTTNQFLVSTIFFTIMNISFFNLRFNLFSIISKEVKQIRNNVVCIVARLVFVFFCAPNAFQHILVNYKKSDFYSPYFQTMLFLVTMRWDVFKLIKNPFIKIKKQLMLTNFTLVMHKIAEKEMSSAIPTLTYL